jgi:hypothetical protein
MSWLYFFHETEALGTIDYRYDTEKERWRDEDATFVLLGRS